jgi:hypothetical protein
MNMQRERAGYKHYKAAFRCDDCPERSDEEGCPRWWEALEEDRDEQGHVRGQRIVVGCRDVIEGRMALEMYRATLRATEMANAAKNEAAKAHRAANGVAAGVVHAIENGLKSWADALPRPRRDMGEVERDAAPSLSGPDR